MSPLALKFTPSPVRIISKREDEAGGDELEAALKFTPSPVR